MTLAYADHYGYHNQETLFFPFFHSVDLLPLGGHKRQCLTSIDSKIQGPVSLLIIDCAQPPGCPRVFYGKRRSQSMLIGGRL